MPAVPLVGSLARRVSHALVPPEARVWVEVPSGPAAGLRFLLNPRFERDYWLVNFESRPLAALLAALPPGGVLYDVGAHIGVVSLLGARAVGPHGRVVALEPDPGNVMRLRGHVAANGASQVEVVAAAAWSAPGTVTFAPAGGSSARNTGRVADGVGVGVPATTLDEVASRLGPPDVLKLDVEGGEAEVLAGSRRILTEDRPRMVVEVHHAAAEARVLAALREHGYAWEWLAPGPYPRHLEAWPAERPRGVVP